jgi:hypothetical protein
MNTAMSNHQTNAATGTLTKTITSNQIGESPMKRLITLAAVLLLASTAAFAQFETDHFKCYLPTSTSPIPTVQLKDQFAANGAKVKTIWRLCNPTKKDHNGVITPITNPDTHLAIHRAGPQPPLLGYGRRLSLIGTYVSHSYRIGRILWHLMVDLAYRRHLVPKSNRHVLMCPPDQPHPSQGKAGASAHLVCVSRFPQFARSGTCGRNWSLLCGGSGRVANALLQKILPSPARSRRNLEILRLPAPSN